MQHVDALSRAPVDSANEVQTVGDLIYRIDVTCDDWILTMQSQDPKLLFIIKALKGDVKSDQISPYRKEYTIKNNRLYRNENDKLLLVIPSAVRWRMIKYFHDDYGHFGVDSTVERIKQEFWFRRMKNYVKSYINACIECYFNKRPGGAPEGRLYGIDIIPIPFRILHMDYLGPFPRSSRGNLYILGITDAFSKYIIVAAVKSTKTTTALCKLNELTTYFGLPEIIVTDRGSAFTSSAFSQFWTTNNVRHVKNAVRSPRSNGQIERINQSILNFLRTTVENSRNWDQHLRNLQWIMNTHKNSTTQFSPNDLVFDFRLNDIIPNRLIQIVNDDKPEIEVDMIERRKLACANIVTAREKWKKRFDSEHKEPKKYEEENLVVIENIPTNTGESRKLEPLFKGPYIIKKVLQYDRYVVGDIDGAPRNSRKFQSIFSSEK